jgi:hypothetical protein
LYFPFALINTLLGHLIPLKTKYRMTNDEILDRIIEKPFSITPLEKDQIIESEENLFEKLRDLVRRIFDINERTLLEQSDANAGFLGRLNRKSQKKRIKRYNRRIKDPAFDRSKEGHLVIVAEGDSWFQFPFFVKDVVDWLTRRNPHYAIYSIAYGGDWMTNMIYDGKYVEELSIHKPDVFLLSGGGNDLVGSNRIAIMVDKINFCTKYSSIEEIPELDLGIEYKTEVLEAQKYITKEFYSFLLVLELQYRKIITSINKKYPELLIITHGYAFAIPSYSHSFDLLYPLKFIVNWALDSGKWLVRPLRIKGIYEERIQKAIIKTFIFELNCMMDQLAHQYPNVYRVNAIEVPKDKKDWFDELHLKTHVFKNVAKIFEVLIQNHAKRVSDPVVLKGLLPGEHKTSEIFLEKKKKVYSVHDISTKK